MAGVAQLVEHRFVVPSVAGSSPVTRPIRLCRWQSRDWSGFDTMQNGMPRLFSRSFFYKKQDKKTGHQMYYVYILQSINNPENFYIGYTDDLKRRLSEHNNGQSIHTNKYKPWKIKNYIAFNDEQKAKDFETYLKTHF